MRVNIITLGCSKNTADSENVAGHLEAAGHTVFFDRGQNDCPCTLINTCGFIGDAKEESIDVVLQQIEVKRRGRTKRRLVVFGCLVQRYRDELMAEMPEVDAWFGVDEWKELVGYVNGVAQPADFDLYQQRSISTPRHYAYLKIAEGCDRACSYCAIPLIRGKHHSRPIDDIVAEAKRLVAAGAKELIVIAQDTTYYGLDIYGRRCLGELLNRLADESGAHWIRLHYTYPASFPDDAIEAIRAHSNICNYIDIPLQHISSGILKSMRRGVDRDETLTLLDKFRQQLPDAAIRTTLIVGYPGETEADFEELKEFVRSARFDRMGCFAYSPEEGTAAGAMQDSVSEDEKQRRVGELMAIQEQVSLEKNEARIGCEYEVLFDRREGDYMVGRTQYDSPEVDDEVLVPVSMFKTMPAVGTFCRVRITQAMENDLMAEPVM